MGSFADQVRGLALMINDSEEKDGKLFDLNMFHDNVIITLYEAAEKIDNLEALLNKDKNNKESLKRILSTLLEMVEDDKIEVNKFANRFDSFINDAMAHGVFGENDPREIK
jgi:molecular chaperone GrpE (heat shock protein)